MRSSEAFTHSVPIAGMHGSLHLLLCREIQPDSQGMLFLCGYMLLIPPSMYQDLKY